MRINDLVGAIDSDESVKQIKDEKTEETIDRYENAVLRAMYSTKFKTYRTVKVQHRFETNYNGNTDYFQIEVSVARNRLFWRKLKVQACRSGYNSRDNTIDPAKKNRILYAAILKYLAEHDE